MTPCFFRPSFVNVISALQLDFLNGLNDTSPIIAKNQHRFVPKEIGINGCQHFRWESKQVMKKKASVLVGTMFALLNVGSKIDPRVFFHWTRFSSVKAKPTHFFILHELYHHVFFFLSTVLCRIIVVDIGISSLFIFLLEESTGIVFPTTSVDFAAS